MGKRFYFLNQHGSQVGEAWRGPFNSCPIPRRGESIFIRCRDKQMRLGKVESVLYDYTALEISIKLIT
jgi:hypothetical protein